MDTIEIYAPSNRKDTTLIISKKSIFACFLYNHIEKIDSPDDTSDIDYSTI